MRIEPEHGKRTEQRLQRLRVARRRNEQSLLGLGRQRRQSGLERAPDARRDRQRIRQRRPTFELCHAQQNRQLEQGEWIAGRRVDQAPGDCGRHGACGRGGKELPGRGAIESVHVQLEELRSIEDIRLVVADGDEDGHSIGVEPARCEEQSLR